MGILDEAIKEHLELKRQHGAGESELKQLEDEAFGAAERPAAEEAAAEAPTEFMAQPEVEEPAEPSSAGEPPAERRPPPDIADLQEAPLPEPKPPPEAERQPEPQEPAEEEAPAMEHEAIPEPAPPAEPQPEPSPEPEAASEPEPPSGPSTLERESIAEQPTELYDVEEELSGSPAPAPTEDELVEEEIGEPRLAPVDPLPGTDEVEEEEEESEQDVDDFFDEKRLSDELDQALEAPPAEDRAEEPEAEPADEPEAGEPPTGQQEDDVLEETPDFLEEAPEDDQLWFEQKPPKDFDFDD
jgi:hypothetical protein